MSRLALRRTPTLVIALAALAAVLAVSTSLGVTGALGTAAVPLTTSSDPTVLSSWSGYGVGTTSPNAPIVDVLGSFIVPNETCPSPNASANANGLASEAIEVALDHFGPAGNLKADGAGVLIICVLGSPVYRAFVQQAPFPAFILPILISPGNVINVNITLTQWTFLDRTTIGGATAKWTAAVPIVKAHNSAECVVSRETALGLLPPQFKPLPATVPTALTNPVEFGSKYAIPSPAVGVGVGCWYSSPEVTGAPGGWMGIGNDPSPPFIALQFDLANPNAANEVTPGPLVTGALLDDSFIVP